MPVIPRSVIGPLRKLSGSAPTFLHNSAVASFFYKLSMMRFAPTPASRTWRFANFYHSLANRKSIPFNVLAASPVAYRLLTRFPRFSLHALDAQQSDRPPGTRRLRGGGAIWPRNLGHPT